MIAAIALTAALTTHRIQTAPPLVAVSNSERLSYDHERHLEHEAVLRERHLAAAEAAAERAHAIYVNRMQQAQAQQVQQAAAPAVATPAQNVQPAQAQPATPAQPVQPQQPAQTAPASSAGVPSGYAANVAQAESTDNPDATNGDHWGLYQMTPNLWQLGGGSAASYGSASASEQTQVFNNIVANNINGGTQNWQPYDGVTP
jgi:hypothetical protein